MKKANSHRLRSLEMLCRSARMVVVPATSILKLPGDWGYTVQCRQSHGKGQTCTSGHFGLALRTLFGGNVHYSRTVTRRLHQSYQWHPGPLLYNYSLARNRTKKREPEETWVYALRLSRASHKASRVRLCCQQSTDTPDDNGTGFPILEGNKTAYITLVFAQDVRIIGEIEDGCSQASIYRVRKIGVSLGVLS